MYRYLVFAFDEIYPYGGMADCHYKTNDFNEAENKVRELVDEVFDCAYIYDSVLDECSDWM